MSDQEEIDFEDAQPLTLSEKAVKFFAGEEESRLQPGEVTEDMLRELYDNIHKLEELSKLVEMQKRDIKRIAGKEENVMRGQFAAFIKHVKGRRSVDYARMVSEVVGKLPDAEMEKYITYGEDSIRLEIRKIN